MLLKINNRKYKNGKLDLMQKNIWKFINKIIHIIKLVIFIIIDFCNLNS